MHPDLVNLGPLHIRSYGMMMAIAFLVGTWLGLREAKRLRLDEDKLVNVILITLVASILGARLLYVLEHLQEFRREWGTVFALWQGGLTLYGGMAAGAFAGLLSAKRFGMPMWVVADALTPSLALGTMFGRVGCFLNGCCYGDVCNIPWIAARFPKGSPPWLSERTQGLIARDAPLSLPVCQKFLAFSCLFVCLFLYLFVCLFVSLFDCLYVCLFVRLFV